MSADGCSRCLGATAPLAWTAVNSKATHTFVHEVHFTVHATRCACGQPFIIVFTERVDFHGGDDTQVELAVAVSADELSLLQAAASLTATLTQLAIDRRFLVKSTGQAPRWLEQGFAIGPHG